MQTAELGHRFDHIIKLLGSETCHRGIPPEVRQLVEELRHLKCSELTRWQLPIMQVMLVQLERVVEWMDLRYLEVPQPVEEVKSPDKKDLRIQDLPLSTQLANILLYRGIKDQDWEKLRSLKDSELLSYKNLGYKGLIELDKALSKVGRPRYAAIKANALEDCTCCSCDCGACRGCSEGACSSCDPSQESP